jgi:hypothetical protein
MPRFSGATSISSSIVMHLAFSRSASVVSTSSERKSPMCCIDEPWQLYACGFCCRRRYMSVHVRMSTALCLSSIVRATISALKKSCAYELSRLSTGRPSARNFMKKALRVAWQSSTQRLPWPLAPMRVARPTICSTSVSG